MKGVSPLIGAVVLIGITITLAIFVSSWSKSFTISEAKKTEEYTGVECSYMKINVYDAIYYNSTKKLVLELGASSSLAVSIEKITLTDNNYNKYTYVNGANFSLSRLEPGEREYAQLTSVPENFTKVRIIPSSCPMNAVSITSDEVTVE